MNNIKIDDNSEWFDVNETTPASGLRYLVTDGHIILIATYIVEPNGKNIWIFSGLDDSSANTFVVHAWMPLPNIPKLIIINEETN